MRKRGVEFNIHLSYVQPGHSTPRYSPKRSETYAHSQANTWMLVVALIHSNQKLETSAGSNWNATIKEKIADTSTAWMNLRAIKTNERKRKTNLWLQKQCDFGPRTVAKWTTKEHEAYLWGNRDAL